MGSERVERQIGKTFFQIGMDAFFVSVEELFDPSPGVNP
jgi:hypothetical protein